MGLIKKNIPFFCLLAVALIVFAAGVVLLLGALGAKADAGREYRAARQQMGALAASDPAPTRANLEASQANVASLRETLAGIREDLQRGSKMELNTDGVQVMAAIQQYITSNRQRLAEADPPIGTPDDFAFGFDLYARESTPPAERFIPVLDKQRQILRHLLDKLVRSGPERIGAVRRERPEVSGEGKNKGYTIDPEVSARVPGAIDTLAFELVFTGYTDVLRAFLNELAAFEFPIVVRSIEVRRPEVRKARPAAAAEDVFSIFGAAPPEDEAEAGERSEEQRPVIEENLSEFTVTLEFIEVVLPPETDAAAGPGTP